LGYTKVNAILRSYNEQLINMMGFMIEPIKAAFILYDDSSTNLLMKGKKDITLYKGSSFKKNRIENVFENNAILTFPEFFSTSARKDVAEAFSKSSSDDRIGVIYEILVKYDKKLQLLRPKDLKAVS
jgi:hypothetical protein